MSLTHYSDVRLGTMASQITSLTIVYSTVYSDADQRKHQSSASMAIVQEFTGYRWIPTNGQLRGKCFHLMTSSWVWPFSLLIEMQLHSDRKNSWRWRHKERNGVLNHRCLDCLFNRMFKRISKKPSTPHVAGFCEGNPPMTGGFPSQGVSDAENVSIWWRHHANAQCRRRLNFSPSYVLYFPFFCSRHSSQLFCHSPSLVKLQWSSKVESLNNHLLGRICLKC